VRGKDMPLRSRRTAGPRSAPTAAPRPPRARTGRCSALEREFRLFDAGGRAYRAGGDKAEAMFVVAVERILDHASAEEDRDDEGGSDAVTGKDRRRSGDGTTASST
jgi:hypothetical protein